LEKRLDDLEFEESDQDADGNRGREESLQTAAPPNGEERANRFNNRSLARSRIKRDGLKAGALAPDFRLPRLDGSGDLSLAELRGERVLLVFSDPHCGPCHVLAPELEKFHSQDPETSVVMISRGDPQENRTKVAAHHLTFPIVLQQQWEISRRYAMFATPIAYLIDEAGVIRHDVAVGVEPILSLFKEAAKVSPRAAGIQSATANGRV
jgi:peroxiredoxin